MSRTAELREKLVSAGTTSTSASTVTNGGLNPEFSSCCLITARSRYIAWNTAWLSSITVNDGSGTLALACHP